MEFLPKNSYTYYLHLYPQDMKFSLELEDIEKLTILSGAPPKSKLRHKDKYAGHPEDKFTYS